MYLRPYRKTIDGELYEYWALVKSVRTERGPRQQVVAHIGKEPGLDRQSRVGWDQIASILDGRANQDDFLEDENPDPPQWAHVDVSNVSIERMRQFGNVYLALALWRRLGLDAFFDQEIESGREEIRWSVMACVLTLARFCAPSSELQIAESWYGKTALEDLLGVAIDKINADRLYRALDAALPCREELFRHLQNRYAQWFGSEFDILLYDITSTYFEGRMECNPQAQRGYSRDSRPDCLQVCIGIVVTPEGLPLAYEVFDGNRSDVTTVEEIIETMREKYGHERRVWVMDRGMVSEENLEQLRQWDAKYLVATPKSMMKDFKHEMHEGGWAKMENGVEVKMCRTPDGAMEKFVLCRSPGRIEKDRAIRDRQIKKLDEAFSKLKRSTEKEKRALRNRSTAERRVGRLFERYPRGARFFDVQITEHPDPIDSKRQRLDVQITRRDDIDAWADLSDGCYLLRTNMIESDPQFLWQTYIGLTQVEQSFRIEKSDLGLRPIYHHTEKRAQAHIMICFLSLVMWRSLELWMDGAGLGTCPRKLVEEISEVRSMDVVLPVKENKQLRLRVVSRPEKRLALLLDRLKLPLPNQPKRISNVVKKITVLEKQAQ